LSLGLSLHGATNDPYALTRAATNGPDVVANAFPTGPGNVSANPAELTPLEHARGVLASSGSFPVTWAALRAPGTTGVAEVEGRSVGRSLVDQPKLTEGTWLRSGGVVVERGFATGLGIRVGDRITLAGHPFAVVGIAVTAAVPNYTRLCVFGCDGPTGNPGFVWLTEADATRVSKWASQPVMYFLNLKLKDPASAEAFAISHDSASANGATLFSWQQIRDADSKIVMNAQLVLVTGSWLLGLLAVASVAVLVGGRMAEESRRVGLLKAVGGTPSFVAAVLLVENLILALCAAAIGLVAGWLAAPLVNGPGAGLLGTAGVPPITAATVALVVAVAVAVAFLATLVPAIRAARTSTVRLLDDGARAPRRRAWMIAPSRHLPVALLIGARLAARRPRRLLLNIVSVAITASGIVAVLVVHATVNSNEQGFFAPGDPVTARLHQVTMVLSVMLVVLAAVNAVFIAWATVLDARHSSALTRALGATRLQATTGLVSVQVLPALIGAILGIPGGVAIYAAAKNGGGSTSVPPVLWLVGVVLGTMLVLGALTTIPARIGARRSLAESLQSEAA
jgi:ABC-type lipoprotein release transport system permease subunit